MNAVEEQTRALTLIRVYEATVGVPADFANPLHNPGRVVSYVLAFNNASQQLGTAVLDDHGYLARPAALDAPLPSPQPIPARSPIGTALAVVLGIVLIVLGVALALSTPRNSGGTVAAFLLISLGGAVVTRLSWVLR